MRRLLFLVSLCVALLGLSAPPSSAGAPTSISAAQSTGWVFSGTAVTISGKLSVGGGASAAGRTLVVYARSSGGGWIKVAVTRSDSTGAYAVARPVRFNTSFQVRYGAAPGVAAAVSRVVSVAVRPKVTASMISLPRGPLLVGQTLVASGQVASWFYGAVVDVQVLLLPSGRWQTISTGRVNSTGHYGVRFNAANAGNWDYRVLIPRSSTRLAVSTTDRDLIIFK